MTKEYDISKAANECFGCGQELPPGARFVATVRDSGPELRRQDYCLKCWENAQNAEADGLLAVWRSQRYRPEEKKKLFVDNEMLIDFFQRLQDPNSEAKVSFRYVLALVLMRKKLLVYDRMRTADDGTEVWLMHFKNSQEVHEVIDPKMDDDKIANVSGQLSQILEGEP